jgi:predicted Na+-dependent transporter
VTARRVLTALHGATWTALGVAFLGALATPRNYCYYEGAPHPTAEIVVMAALLVAFVMLVAAMVVTAARDSTLRQGVIVVGSASAAVVAGVWIVWLTHQHVMSWGCG